MDELSKTFLCFVGYSFLGWVCETIYCSILAKKFINRGFLNGPFCPIYGFGALILLKILGQVPHQVILVFLAGVLITTALEYFTGYLLEKLFHAKWWDYSQNKFNFRGRICLLNSILFGLMAVALIFSINPAADNLITSIQRTVRLFISAGFMIYFAADLTVTVKSMQSLNMRLEALSKALASAKEKLDVSGFYNALNISQRMEKLHELMETDRGKAIYASISGVRERIKQIESDNRVFQKRIIKAFPDIRSTRYPEMLNIVKEKIMHTKKGTVSNDSGSDDVSGDSTENKNAGSVIAGENPTEK